MSQPLTIQHGFTDDQRQAVAEVIHEGFKRKLAPLLGDRGHTLALLAAGLRPEGVLLAAQDGRVLGVAGLKYGREGFMEPVMADFVRVYGPLLAPLRRWLFEFMESPEPEDFVYVDAMAVRAGWRGRGIGARLLEATFDFARERGYPQVVLDVVDTNPDARRLYERMGFTPVRVERFPVMGLFLGFRSATVMKRGVEAAAESDTAE